MLKNFRQQTDLGLKKATFGTRHYIKSIILQRKHNKEENWRDEIKLTTRNRVALKLAKFELIMKV